jgi:hypothetical protein
VIIEVFVYKGGPGRRVQPIDAAVFMGRLVRSLPPDFAGQNCQVSDASGGFTTFKSSAKVTEHKTFTPIATEDA